MHHIIYLSLAVAPFTGEQLARLLALARRRNTELAITGILLYGNERFLQVLEGEEEAVRAVYELIKRDPHHQNIITYADKPIAQRAFAEWAMAFEHSDLQQFTGLFGYLGPTDAPLDTSGLPAAEQHIFDLLRAFTLP